MQHLYKLCDEFGSSERPVYFVGHLCNIYTSCVTNLGVVRGQFILWDTCASFTHVMSRLCELCEAS